MTCVIVSLAQPTSTIHNICKIWGVKTQEKIKLGTNILISKIEGLKLQLLKNMGTKLHLNLEL